MRPWRLCTQEQQKATRQCRRTDSARVIDSGQHSVRLYTTAADSPIVLQRPDGTFEKQYRQYSAGKLPVAYRYASCLTFLTPASMHYPDIGVGKACMMSSRTAPVQPPFFLRRSKGCALQLGQTTIRLAF